MPARKRASLLHHQVDYTAVGAALIAALLVKFFWPLFAFEIPLGYDVGMYRYLFIRHAEGLPPFFVTELEPWAKGHPLGLFFFTTIFLRLGLPVDWLLGWIWNLFPVVLAATLAFIIRARHGNLVALGTLVAALLSIAYFDGFAAMYWKTLVSLLWCVLTFYFLEQKSWWAAVTGILTVATHHQTGLLFGLTLLTWLSVPFIPILQSTKRTVVLRSLLLPFVVGVCIFIVGLLWYLPVWQDAVAVHIPALLGQGNVASGTFPEPLFFLRVEGILLALGVYGFILNVRLERWTLWQIAVLWCAVFVVLQLLFYRRFFLHLDFFLLPFAGMAMVDIYKRFADERIRMALVALLVVQLVLTYSTITSRSPNTDTQTHAAIVGMSDHIPSNAYVMALENESVVALRGWLPQHRVGGPGLFDSSWTYQQWQSFLLGSNENRRQLLATLTAPVYVFVSPFFRSYYGDAMTHAITSDPCFSPTDLPFLYQVTCTQP